MELSEIVNRLKQYLETSDDVRYVKPTIEIDPTLVGNLGHLKIVMCNDTVRYLKIVTGIPSRQELSWTTDDLLIWLGADRFLITSQDLMSWLDAGSSPNIKALHEAGLAYKLEL